MATLDQLQAALVNADAAGDVEAAKALAAEIQKQRAASPGGATEEQPDFSFSEMAKNILPSAGRFASDMAQPFIHPIDTSRAVGNLAMGAVEKLIPGEQGHERYADQVGHFIKDRYGSFDAVKQTAMSDPVGMLADASGLLTGGGMLAARAPGKIGKAMSGAGAAIDPLNVAANTAKTAVGKMTPKDLPAKMYERSAKWGTTIPQAERTALSNTALDYKLLPTAKGADKLEAAIGGLNDQLDTLIHAAQDAGKTIPKEAVFTHLKQLRKRKGGPLLEAGKDLDAIEAIAKAFDENLKRLDKDFLTPHELQTLKLDTYKKINWDAKRMTGSPIKEDTYKAVAKGAKEGLESIAPEVKGVNQQLGPLYELQPHLQRAAGRIGNRQLISINAPLNATAGSSIGGPVGAAIGTGVSILEIPQVAARNAIKLKAMQNKGLLNMTDNSIPWSAARMGLLQAGRLKEKGHQ